MDWFQTAKIDWDVYHNPYRINMFVQKGKITAVQYEEITGEPHTM